MAADAVCRINCEHKNASSNSDTVCKDNAQDLNQKSGETEKSVCMDCHHCCSSHILYSQPFAVTFKPVVATTVLSAQTTHKGEYLFSLLRPPKTLV